MIILITVVSQEVNLSLVILGTLFRRSLLSFMKLGQRSKYIYEGDNIFSLDCCFSVVSFEPINCLCDFRSTDIKINFLLCWMSFYKNNTRVSSIDVVLVSYWTHSFSRKGPINSASSVTLISQDPRARIF